MSGNVPPPPPPPGPAQGQGDDSPRESARRASAAAPPSFAPGPAATPGPAAAPGQSPAAAAGGAPTQVQQPPTSPHAPIPPAPGQPPAAATQVQPQPQYTAPVRQPAYQPTAYQQPAYQQPAYQQPPAQQYGYTPQQYAYQQQPTAHAGTAPNPTAPTAKRGGTRLTPGWIAFIAADVILIVVAVVFAINVLGGSDVPSVEAGGEPAAVASQDAQDGADGDEGDEDAEEEPAAGPGEQVATFASPSRNISCEIFENQVSCAIAELNQQPAPVDGCDGISGYVVTLDGEGEVALPCVASAEKPKKAPKKLDDVPYGESVTEGDFTCNSEQDGMYCQHDPTGKGFSLARAGVGTY